MVGQGNIDGPARRHESPRHRHVSSRHCEIAGRVIVRRDDAGCSHAERGPEERPRPSISAIDIALAHLDGRRDQSAMHVEGQAPEVLDRECADGKEDTQRILGCRDDRTNRHAPVHESAVQFECSRKATSRARTEAQHMSQVFFGHVSDAQQGIWPSRGQHVGSDAHLAEQFCDEFPGAEMVEVSA